MACIFPLNQRKKALSIGISYKGQKGPYGMPADQFELSGAHFDALRVCKLLIDHYDYHEENIELLIDSPGHTPPTKENIVSAMKRLTASAKPGECLFLFFTFRWPVAGHGDQITNTDGTEDDGKDEIILPLDWHLDESKHLEDPTRYSDIIMDDDMNDILIKPLPSGCRFSSLFDSCHSGTILDLPYSRYYGPLSVNNSVESLTPTSPRLIPPSSPTAIRQLNTPLKEIQTRIYHDSASEALPDTSRPGSPISPIELAHANHLPVRGPLDLSYTYTRLSSRGRFDPFWRDGAWVLRGEHLDHQTGPDGGACAVSWSACSDGQNGYEVSFPSASAGGVMVKAFVDILNENPYRTYGDILKCVGDRLREACVKINRGKPRSEWILQEPQLGTNYRPVSTSDLYYIRKLSTAAGSNRVIHSMKPPGPSVVYHATTVMLFGHAQKSQAANTSPRKTGGRNGLVGIKTVSIERILR